MADPRKVDRGKISIYHGFRHSDNLDFFSGSNNVWRISSDIMGDNFQFAEMTVIKVSPI
jgi:hypothetical protein